MHDHLAPLVGAVVWCWMPHTDSVMEPGPKRRPVLVLDADRSGLLVAYGTSNLGACYRGEFILRPDDLPNLPKPTRFSVAKTLRLPATAAFFADRGHVSVIGRLPARALAKLADALREVDLLK